MACNTCLKSFSLLRPEKGCPNCGFSYCSKCINHKIFLKKINSEAKVCIKCSRTANSNEPIKVNPPDVYYKRINAFNPSMSNDSECVNSSEKEIYDRLQKLKDNKEHSANFSTDDIAARLQNLKGEIPSTSDAEIAARLANLKGLPTCEIPSKAALPKPDLRTEQEQADDLFKQYLDQAKIDSNYSNEFDGLVSDIEKRLENLKGTSVQKTVTTIADNSNILNNEDEILRKIIEEAKEKISLEESEICDTTSVVEELPFCEICNEDANMRCLGCKYLFCKRCFLEHKDDDDGCNRYEPYTGPKNAQ